MSPLEWYSGTDDGIEFDDQDCHNSMNSLNINTTSKQEQQKVNKSNDTDSNNGNSMRMVMILMMMTTMVIMMMMMSDWTAMLHAYVGVLMI